MAGRSPDSAPVSRWPNQGLAVIVLTYLDEAPIDGVLASIAVEVMPELRNVPAPRAAPATR